MRTRPQAALECPSVARGHVSDIGHHVLDRYESFDPASMADDIEHDRLFTGRDAWEAWWDAYDRRMTAQGAPKSVWPGKQKDALYGPSAPTLTRSRRYRTFRGPLARSKRSWSVTSRRR